MPSSNKYLSDYHRTLWLTAAFAVLFVLTFLLYVRAEKQIDRANDLRHTSLQLAEELRQSSDDLTRMVRTYVGTGNPVYKQHFQEILDIRDGKTPRPVDYQNIYWDLVLEDDRRPRPEGTPIALLELMRQARFTPEEFAKLAEAKASSDDLTRREFAALQLFESAAEPTQTTRELARRMLHDAAYHQAKAGIMRPIAEFNEMISRRTTHAVSAAESEALLMRYVFILFGALLGFTLLRAYRSLHLTLGGSVEALHQHISHLGSGNFSLPITVAGEHRDSVLGWLVEMKARLQQSDIRRKQIEAELQINIQRLSEAQRVAHVGSWHLDLLSGKLLWSDEIFRLFEIDPTHFAATYEAFLDAIHPDDRERVADAYADSLARRSPYEITHRLLMRDGRVKWVHERCSTEFDAQGKPLRYMGTVQDITERKAVDEQLRIAAAAFESQEGMLVTDAAGVVLRVNKAFTDTTGYAPEDIVGQTPSLLRSGRHDAAFYSAMWESITRKGAWQGEVWDKHKSGRIYPKWLNISAVKGADGQVTHYIGTHYDITERKKAEEKINTLAFYDQLTALPNRVLLMDRLSRVMAAGLRTGNFAALLFIDLDNFKTLNDTQGHEMGDMLLKQVAARLTQSIRDEDTAARQGGDEFVVLLAGLGPVEKDAARVAEAVAEKILAELNQTYALGTLSHHSGASIGVTLFRGHQASVDDLMKQADLAMYRAKASGRNVVRFFDPAMEAAVQARAALEGDLRRAIDEKQFLLHYQPQVVGDGRITGAEALMRWQHPQRGMVSPAEFIPLAEESDLILPLGSWVLRTACSQLAAWAERPAMAALSIAVNVSAKQFRQRDFVAQVLAVIEQTGANPRRLKLELTESLLVQDVEEIIEKMHQLKGRGIGFSLDDFGTGYSSLSYLKRLPLDQLKIDQSFVRDLLSDPNDAAIARTIVALAQSLGLAVIAEGVETLAQRDCLASHGCHAYQGYFFCKPLPIGDFEQHVRGAESLGSEPATMPAGASGAGDGNRTHGSSLGS